MMQATTPLVKLIFACQDGDLEQIQRWHRQNELPLATALEQFEDDRGFSERVSPLQAAADHGQLAVVKWFFVDSGQAIDLASDDHLALKSAARRGRSEVVKWIIEDSGAFVEHAALYASILDETAAGGHLEDLRKYADKSRQSQRTISVSRMLQRAAANGHLQLIQWILGNFGVDANDPECTKVLAQAIWHGHLAVIKWFVSESQLPTKIVVDSYDACSALVDGHTDTIRWVLEESGQLAQILEHVDDDNDWLQYLPEDLERSTRRAMRLNTQLRELQVPVALRNAALASEACRKAVDLGVVSDLESLKQLLEISKKTEPTSKKQLKL